MARLWGSWWHTIIVLRCHRARTGQTKVCENVFPYTMQGGISLHLFLGGDGGVKHDFYMTNISQKESMALNSLSAWTGEMCFFWEPRLTRVWHSSGFSRFTRGFFSGAFMRQDTTGELTAAVPYTFWYLVEATYDALTVSTTAFMRFLAAWINEVALSSCKRVQEKNFYGHHKLHLL